MIQHINSLLPGQKQKQNKKYLFLFILIRWDTVSVWKATKTSRGSRWRICRCGYYCLYNSSRRRVLIKVE